MCFNLVREALSSASGRKCGAPGIWLEDILKVDPMRSNRATSDLEVYILISDVEIIWCKHYYSTIIANNDQCTVTIALNGPRWLSGLITNNGVVDKRLCNSKGAAIDGRFCMLVSSQQEVQHDLVEPGRVLELWSMACFLYDLHSCFPIQRSENSMEPWTKSIQPERRSRPFVCSCL
jgi:hypothetical protein